MANGKHFFTSESVTEGHPDKMADQISDAVLDAVLKDDPNGHVACETFVTTGMALVGGEIRTSTYVDITKTVRDTVKGIGYDNARAGFDWKTCAVINVIQEQSKDIAQGVDETDNREQGAGDQLQEIQDMTDQTIRNLRRITRDLRPLYLEDLGLVATLEMLTRETSNSIGIPVDFQNIGIERRYSPEVELTLYRIAQEGLNNVFRHAQASHASVVIHFNPQTTILTVADDGNGFVVPDSPAEFAPSGHYGLLGLHERADLIGAQLEIHSAPDQGTRLVITLASPGGENTSGVLA